MKCPNCSNEVPDTASVCGYCGNRLKSAAPPPQPEVQPLQRSSTGIPGWTWGCVGVVLVVGIAGLLIFLASAPSLFAPVTNNQSNQTAEPVAPIQVVITATRRAPSPTQPASQETGWVSVVEDDFSDPDSPWWAITLEEEYSTYYEGGTYHIEVDISDTYYWQSLGYGDLRDVNVEVQMRLVDGYAEDSSMGVLCRQSGQNYYLFEINNAGQSRIRKYTEAEGWENLTDWEYGDSIQPNIWNTIYIECFGKDLIMTVNDVLVARAMDASLTSGDVGLAAGAIPTAGLHVEFDDFKLWEYR